MSEQNIGFVEAALVDQSLELQGLIMDDLKHEAATAANGSTHAGLGRHAIMEWGMSVVVDSRLWTEEELSHSGTLYVEVEAVQYRIEIRQGQVQVRNTATNEQITDVEMLGVIARDVLAIREHSYLQKHPQKASI